ncbi:MAG: type II CRISPR-associated endonuclease Cas1 [Bacteroidales bacterium]|nr:type II CRISPR-associated endonuclease Cas1 [Bacteroidales bacterium]
MIKHVVYFGNPAHIRLERKQLKITLKLEPPEEKSIPIEDVGVVIIDHPQITITSGALSELMENNVAVITCNDSYLPNGLLLPLEGHHVQSQRIRAQIQASEPLVKNLWRQTVQAKIYNQAHVLEFQGDKSHPLLEFYHDVRSGDTTNREAAAAHYYWAHVFPSMPHFTRDPVGPYPNNLLNYGYAILRAVMARAIVAAGLFPSLGIHHHNKYNAYCLADDLMEPYRPYVDLCVIHIMKKYPHDKELTKEIKKELLTIPLMDVHLENEKSPLLVASHRTATSLAHCFLNEKRKILYPRLNIKLPKHEIFQIK